MTTTTNKSKPANRNTNVRMKVLKCENCGAPITPDAVGCEYCGASFVIEGAVEDVGTITEWSKLIQQANSILTPNEARRYLNLDGVEEVYSAYDSDGMLIKQFVKED